MIASKASIAVFLLRIAVGKLQQWAIYFTLILGTVPSIIFFFVCMFQCKPISFFWVRFVDPTAQGSCINLHIIMMLTYVFSVIAVITDFAFTILPIFMVWKLNMKAKSKWLLAPVFLLGCM
jgi:hypothetical protein